MIVFNPEVAGVLLRFVASQLASLLAGQTEEAISSQSGALALNQAPKCVHYLLLLIKGAILESNDNERTNIILLPPLLTLCQHLGFFS